MSLISAEFVLKKY